MNETFFQGNIAIHNTKDLEQYKLLNIIDAIRTGKLDKHDFKEVILKIRSLSLQNQKPDIKKLKERLPFVLTSGLVRQADVANNIIYHTGCVQLDFDWVEPLEMESRLLKSEQTKEKLKEDPYVLIAFISPSGGLKVVCKILPDISNHDSNLDSIVSYFLKKYGITHDPSCIGIKRAMYLSFDPSIYVNEDCQVYLDYEDKRVETTLPAIEVEAELSDEEKKGILRQLDDIIALVEDRQLDFAPSYAEYRNVGFALVPLGEEGRQRYHALCQFSAKYKEEDCNKQFDVCSKTYNGKIKIGTVFHYAKIHELVAPNKTEINSDSQKQSQPINESDLDKLDQLLEETTPLPDHIFENIPEPLRSSAALFQDLRVRDLFLLSLITVLSSLFHRVHGLYDNARVFSNLYCFVIGPAASGKGVVRWALRCIDGVVKYLSSLNIQESIEIDSPEEKGKQKEKPVPSAILIPGNSSIAGLIQLLSKNPVALMAESEAEAISKLFDVSFGDYSDKLRQIWHHELIYSYRKIGREYVTIDEPKMSLMATGTPSQIESLVRGSSDGLFSRFIYYSFSGRPKYRSPFNSKVSFKALFEVISADIFEMFKKFNETDCEFKLTETQVKKFDEVIERWQSLAYNLHRNVGVSIVNRMGLILFRIAMVLTILRNRAPSPILLCSDQDFSTALGICEILRVHSFTVLRVIPREEVVKPDESKMLTAFFKALPHEFKYSEGVSLSEMFGISPRQAKRYIKELTKKGMLKDGDPKKGFYKKA